MMKKIMIVLLAAMMMLSSVSLAEDLSSQADADLLSLYRRISIELESRNIDPKAVYPEDAFSGDDLWTKDMAERLEKFFGFWNASDIPNMLSVCSPGWKAGRDHPDTELLTILGNRTVTDFGINSVSRGPVDSIRIVLLSAGFDTKDGNNPANEIVSISMTREEDGLWYVDPGSMVTFGYTADSTYAEPAPDTAEETPETAMDTVLYYVPEGGEYYHADQNCKRINEKFLPMKGSFTYAELEDEPYKDLMPCEICGAPLRRENPSPSAGLRDAAAESSPFETFRDVVMSMGIGGTTTITDGYAVAVFKQGERFLRVVASFDEQAEEMYTDFLDDGSLSLDEYRALSEYADSLPVQYTEELTVVPFSQEELDSMAGKTIGEVMSEPWELRMSNYPEDAEAGKEIAFPMVKGFCEYRLVINEPFETYQERRAGDRYDPVTIMSLRNYLDLTVKRVEYAGFSSSNAILLSYQADGTVKRDTDPFPEDYDYDLMEKIADDLAVTWQDVTPDPETKEAMIAELIAEYPEAAEMIRQIVNSFH